MPTLDRKLIVVELKKIETNVGYLSAEAVVLAATPPNHPLNSYFEWDDTVAGHKYRLSQARTLLTIKVTQHVGTPPVKRSVPFAVSLTSSRNQPSGHYVTMRDVLARTIDERQMAIDVLHRCIGDLRNHPTQFTNNALMFLEKELQTLTVQQQKATQASSPPRVLSVTQGTSAASVP